MRKIPICSNRHTLLHYGLAWLLLSAFATTQASKVDLKKGTLELSPLPVDLAQAIAPNIVVTFDDSASMAWNYMGDAPPFGDSDFGANHYSWNGPWLCAAVVDPSPSTHATQLKLRDAVMNGVYYNPNVTYEPPLRADGTSFPQAGPLTEVWVDGIAVNRKFDPVPIQAVKFLDNPHLGMQPSGAVANLMRGDPDGGWPLSWRCGFSGDNADHFNNYHEHSPMDGKDHELSDGTWVHYPLGGPYYYRLKRNVAISTNDVGVPIDANQLRALYTASNWEAVPVPLEQHQNFANWYAYYRNRSLAARTAISRVFGALGKPQDDGSFGSLIRVTWQNLNDPAFQLPSSAIITDLLDRHCIDGSHADPKLVQAGQALKAPSCYRSAFFNWLFTTKADGATPARSATIRAGEFYKRRDHDLRGPYWHDAGNNGKGGEVICRQNFHLLVADGIWNADAPSRLGLVLPTGAIKLPDGVTFPSPSASPLTRIYQASADRGGSASLSDLAFHYWATNLRPDLYDPSKNKFVAPRLVDRSLGVTPSNELSGSRLSLTNVNREMYFNPANDPATWPHMSQYLIGMGVRGRLEASRDTSCVDEPTSDACRLRKGQIDWPSPHGAHSAIENIDDTWHAAVTSRGQYFSASDPQSLIDQLGTILLNLVQRDVPASLGRTSSSVLVPGALGFLTSYAPGDWSGDLTANALSEQGDSGEAAWSAAQQLDRTTDPKSRIILTSRRRSDGYFDVGIPLRNEADLDMEARRLLAQVPAPAKAADTAQARLDWLRGDRTHEKSHLLRDRSSLFGAVVNAQALYVAYPASGYLDRWPDRSPEAIATASGRSYRHFVANHLHRRPVVYVAANDGMLHAIDAGQEHQPGPILANVPTPSAGRELFAYVPRAVFPHLGNLTRRTPFQYMPTVDSTPVTRDVYFSHGSQVGWRSLLVGALRLGGRGIYALDVTDPDEITEANAAQKVLWEFHAGHPDRDVNTDPANLGYTFGQPNIARLAHGGWVVLVPGGYFPDCSAATQPLDCVEDEAARRPYGSLFVLDAQSGELIREIRTPTGNGVISHGLSSPVLGDYEHDQIDDVAFAGDLVGHLWRFDLSSARPADWSASLLYQPDTPAAQPITVMPRLLPDPGSNRFMVVFGTGQYLGTSDNHSTIPVQSIYGIRERDRIAKGTTVRRSDLLKQDLAQASADDGVNTVRGLTNRPLPDDALGWFIDLDVTAGERVVVTPTILFDTLQIIVATLIPDDDRPCHGGPGGAFLTLNGANGGSGSGISQPHYSDWEGDSPIRGVGALISNPPISGNLPALSEMGGGHIVIPGMSTIDGKPVSVDAPLWGRRSWRRLQ